MAHTTSAPLEAVTGYGGTTSIPVFEGQAADGAIAKGDVLVWSSGLLDEDNTAPAVDLIVGVALEDSTAANDLIRYVPALPGVVFEANMVNGANDYTGVQSTGIGVVHGIEQTDQGYAAIDISDATDVAATIQWGRQRSGIQDSDPGSDGGGSGVGVANPRVRFTFVNTFWNQSA